MLDGSRVRFIEQIPAAHRLRAVSAIGEAFPLHCTANGKALLAALPREHAERLLPRRLERCAPATITSRQQLWAELELVRRDGIAFDREEHMPGICAAGIAIRTFLGELAAVTVVAPAQRFAAGEQLITEALLRVPAQ